MRLNLVYVTTLLEEIRKPHRFKPHIHTFRGNLNWNGLSSRFRNGRSLITSLPTRQATLGNEPLNFPPPAIWSNFLSVLLLSSHSSTGTAINIGALRRIGRSANHFNDTADHSSDRNSRLDPYRRRKTKIQRYRRGARVDEC